MGTQGDIYTEHFGLDRRPFTLVPDPGFLFWSGVHRRAYTMLEYGLLTRAPVTLITGEIGAGKTTLVHYLMRNMVSDINVGLISNAHGDRGELLRWVLRALGQTTEAQANYVDLFDQFQSLLIDEYAQGRRTMLIFDEAQNLSREALEEMRMFTNINSNEDELLQLILVGQPELRDMIQRPDMVQLAQRIAASFHIPSMDKDTAAAYIWHRMRVAGSATRVFDEGACALIYEKTKGVPRLVNQLCDLSLVYAFSDGRKRITEDIVRKVLADGVFFGAGEPMLQESAK